MKLTWLAGPALLLLGLSCLAQEETGAYLTQHVCELSKGAIIPASDVPSPGDQPVLNSCNSESLYYGFGRKPDASLARKCAYQERETHFGLNASPFTGSGILTMVYANGEGVQPNLELALKFACEIRSAPEELIARVNHLQHKSPQQGQSRFDVCDDALSEETHTWCARRDSKLARANMDAQLEALSAHWTGDQKAALEDLVRSANSFIQLRVRNEIDLRGTGRAPFQTKEEQKQRDFLVSSLEKFEQAEFPRLTKVDWQESDAKLTTIASKIESAKDLHFGTVTPAQVKATQRAWVQYREAWVKFGAVRYPNVSANTWRAWMNRSRAEMLKEFVSAS